MYDLDRKQFKPAMIIWFFPWVPCIAGLALYNAMHFCMEVTIMLSIILIAYVAVVISLWKLSTKGIHYILLKQNVVELKFHDFMDGETKLNLQFDQIVKFEYYRISSIKGWLMLFSFTLPKCVYITYNAEDKVQKKLIGYLDLKDIKEISSCVGVELRIY